MIERRLTFRTLTVVLFAISSCGCSSDFWDRSPRVGGVQCAPPSQAAPTPYACAPAPQTCAPPPQSYAPPAACAPAPQSTYSAQPSAPQPYTAPAPSYGTPCAATQEDMAVLDAVNAIRQSRGLRPFAFDPTLFEAARAHSLEQQRHGYMGHGSPDPARRTLLQRISQAGYRGTVFAEVVAWGYRDVNGVVEGWMNSREHREILVDPELSEAAFSRAGEYWTGNFGVPSRRARDTIARGPVATTPRTTAARPYAAPGAQAYRGQPAPTYGAQPYRPPAAAAAPWSSPRPAAPAPYAAPPAATGGCTGGSCSLSGGG